MSYALANRIDAVERRVTGLEADRERLTSENADLKKRLSKLEGKETDAKPSSKNPGARKGGRARAAAKA